MNTIFDSATRPLRSCRQCRSSKIRCNREVPRCQNCVKRGRTSLCVYETRAPGKSLALLEPQPKRRKQLQESEFSEHHIQWKAFDPQSEQYLQHEKGTTEESQRTIEPANEADIKHLDPSRSGKGDLKSQETSPKRNAATIAENPSISQRRCEAVEDIPDWPRSMSVSQPTELYAQMTPPVINFNL
jgi:hypothetical protein